MPDAGEHRVQREADKHGDQHCGYDGNAKFMEELANDAAHETDGHEHSHDGQRGSQNGQTDLLRPVQ